MEQKIIINKDDSQLLHLQTSCGFEFDSICEYNTSLIFLKKKCKEVKKEETLLDKKYNDLSDSIIAKDFIKYLNEYKELFEEEKLFYLKWLGRKIPFSEIKEIYVEDCATKLIYIIYFKAGFFLRVIENVEKIELVMINEKTDKAFGLAKLWNIYLTMPKKEKE